MKTLLNMTAALILGTASILYASDDLNLIIQESDMVISFSNTATASIANLDNEKWSPIEYAAAAYRLNPLNPPINNISDIHANIIKSAIARELQLTLTKFENYWHNKVSDKGELIRLDDYPRLGLKRHKPIKVYERTIYERVDDVYLDRDCHTVMTNHSSADGKTHCGSTLNNNGQHHSYIVTDNKITDTEIKLYQFIRHADGVKSSQTSAMSCDGSTIVGMSQLINGEVNGFKWTHQTGMMLLNNSKEGTNSSALCTNKNGKIVGGHVADKAAEETVNLIRKLAASIWIDGNYYNVNDLVGQQLLMGNVLTQVTRISPSGRAIYGVGLNEFNESISWLLIFAGGLSDSD